MNLNQIVEIDCYEVWNKCENEPNEWLPEKERVSFLEYTALYVEKCRNGE